MIRFQALLKLSRGDLYRSRIIDIDILRFGDFEMNEDDLKIPHPLMYERDFVMVPLMEICNGKF